MQIIRKINTKYFLNQREVTMTTKEKIIRNLIEEHKKFMAFTLLGSNDQLEILKSLVKSGDNNAKAELRPQLRDHLMTIRHYVETTLEAISKNKELNSHPLMALLKNNQPLLDNILNSLSTTPTHTPTPKVN